MRKLVNYLFFLPLGIFGNTINVGLSSLNTELSLSLEIIKGVYYGVLKEDTIFILEKNNTLTLNPKTHHFELSLKNHQTHLSSLSLIPHDSSALLSLNQTTQTKLLQGNLNFTHQPNQIHTILSIDLEAYVLGVTEAEAGYQLPSEFYITQAILSRTYALKNWEKHQNEGYNLCNTTHCQVFHQICSDSIIIKSIAGNKFWVIINQEGDLIEGIYHSNCGGSTIGSEIVWNKALPHLKWISDSFCTQSYNAQWEKLIHQSEFTNHLEELYSRYPKEFTNQLFHKEVSLNNTSAEFLRFKIELRKKMNLKSAHFYIKKQEGAHTENILIKGFGSGHRVGFCQQGGIQQAKLNKTYDQLLNFYYKDIQIVNYQFLLPPKK